MFQVKDSRTTIRPILFSAALAGALVVTACASKRAKPTASTALANGARMPTPPGGAIADLRLPSSDGKGGYRTINSDIGGTEAIWHVRSALNVAALSCGNRELITNYNALLKKRKAELSTGYAAERKQGSQAALDRHMTQIYNYFAQPPVQAQFCRVAGEVASEAGTIAPAGFESFADRSLDKLEAPFQSFYRSYADYERDLAAWRANPHAPALAARAVKAETKAKEAGDVSVKLASAKDVAAPWRVQLGAFAGTGAAKGAWNEVRRRVPDFTSFTPYYETASRKGLVRLQIGPVTTRADAIRLCAAAASAALDCMPVSS